METSSQSNWQVKSDLKLKKQARTELDRLAEKMVNEFKSKGHLLEMSGPVSSIPAWQSLIKKDATGAVNVLLSIGGTIDEIEYIIRKMHKIDGSLFIRWGGFVENLSGKTNRGALKQHIKYMAAARKTQPKLGGFIFESSHSLDQLNMKS